MADTGDDIVKNLHDTFTFKAAKDKINHAVDSAKEFMGSKPAPKPAPAPAPDTTWHNSAVDAANDSFRQSAAKAATPAPKAAPAKALPKYKDGTDYVPKTGPAVLHKGEAVLKKSDADQHRAAKWAGSVKDELGGDREKPAKKISHIVHKKSTNGDHIFEHHHTHPEHHPTETHTKRGDDEMVEHMLAHAGTPNPGEPDAGQPDAYQAQAPAQGAPAMAPQAPVAGV